MMRLRDTATLAFTKLRTRKIRLTITIVISGLLFAGLVGASMVARGAFASLNTFNKEGLGERYIVAGSSVESSPNFYNDKTVIDRAIAIQKDIVARKTAEAKRLGIQYDPASEPPAFDEFDEPGRGKQRYIAIQTEAGKQAILEFLKTHPGVSDAEFQKGASGFNGKAFYKSEAFPYAYQGRMQVLKGGKETFAQSMTGKESGVGQGPLDRFPSEWTLMSEELLKPFTLDGENLQTGSDGSIPIIVPYSAAEQLLNVRALPATASSSQKLARTKEVRRMAKDVRFTLCYRNPTSAGLIDAAIMAQQEIEQNKNNKNYKKPDLIYGLPTTACGPATIVRDVRTADQKKLDAKQEQFDQAFGKPVASQSTVTFRLVGIVPDDTRKNAAGVNQIISSLVTSSLGSSWFSPHTAALNNPIIASTFKSDAMAQISGQRPTYYAEFKTANEAKKFIEKQNCSPDFSAFESMSAGSTADLPDPNKACKEEEKLFSLAPFGSNSLAIESAKKQFGKFFLLGALGVAIIGAIIMMGTVGRMITDSRRETAVFRAIGAKRLDIAQIYVLYTALLSLMISIFAVVGGSIAAIIVQRVFAEDITVQALVAFNVRDLNQTFSLFDFYWPDLLFLTAIAIGIGLISIAIPLIRNVRRNPIRDMRDDT